MRFKKIVKKRIVLLVFLSLFIFPLFISSMLPAIEGISQPDDIAGLNLSSNADFYAISESDYTTRWILQNSTISAVEDFHDDINTDYWNLVDVGQVDFDLQYSTIGDAYVWSAAPDANYGSASNLYLQYTVGGTYIANAFLSFPYLGTNYLYTNQTGSNELKATAYSAGSATVRCHTTTSFSEGTITYNNAPAPGSTQDDVAVAGAGVKSFTISNFDGYYRLSILYETATSLNFRSKEYGSSIPNVQRTDVNKNYFGSGYMYIQTDTTELIGLKSKDYGAHKTLNSGDYFEVDFQTNSDSQIDLILLTDGGVNTTLTLSPSGNDNFNRHTVQISVDETVEFDQLKISSTFEDEDYVKVYDIKTFKYTLVGDYADFYLGSRRTQIVNLTSSTYNLRIFDPYDDGVKVNENITIGTSDYFYIYTPIETIDCRLTLFNTGKENHLDFEDYHISINRSLNGEWSIFDLLDNIFTADIETHGYINVSDRFDTLIDSFDKITSSYIDLELEVYSLQIKNLMEQRTTLDINSTHVYPLLSGDSVYFTLSKEYYEIGYYDNNNTYQQFTIYLNSNQAYELNRSKMCFLTFTNQRGEYLSFNNYKTYVNESLIYYNVIYRDIGDNVSLEITDLYDISVKNHSFVVQAEDNYVPIILTEYSLKIMNQQEVFNHINITRDPNYYESPFYWSEWVAPSEIIEFTLFAGYYKINLTDNENSAYSFYEYTLNGDDIILISSGNLISSVITNIINVNTTIGNQITNVEINITNQNSAINNSIINVDINLSNVNSTLGNLLTAISLNITNVNNNISALYTFTNNSFINLNNNVNTSFIYMENNIIAINQSISNLVIGIDNSISLINGTISTLITQVGTNLLLMNTSINTTLFNLNTTIDLIGANITSNYILLNNSINLTNVNINDSRIAILNNLVLINNTISTLISDVYSAVYLINNSIYTAVVDVGVSLLLINNSISGNLSIVLQQNDFLTEMYQTTMFSELLDWTGIAGDPDLIDSQIDVWEFINLYKDKAIEVNLRYNDLIETLTVSAQNTIDQYLPAEDVEYRLWSIADEEYLNNWTALPENKTVDFGFFETDLPVDPELYLKDFMVIFAGFFILIIAFVVVVLFIYKINKKKKHRENIWESNFFFLLNRSDCKTCNSRYRGIKKSFLRKYRRRR